MWCGVGHVGGTQIELESVLNIRRIRLCKKVHKMKLCSTIFDIGNEITSVSLAGILCFRQQRPFCQKLKQKLKLHIDLKWPEMRSDIQNGRRWPFCKNKKVSY